MANKEHNIERSISGTALNFISSTSSTSSSISSTATPDFEVYRCGRCGQLVGKYQKKCHNCQALLNWEKV